MGRAFWITGLVLIWTSVVVITIGTHLQTLSPRFAEFEQAAVKQEAGTDGEERFNPAGRMALVLSFTWQFQCCFCGFLALVFMVGGLGIRVIRQRYRELALIGAGAFGLGCLVGAVLAVGDAVRNFQWGFVTLGIGFLFSAVGLVVGGLGVVCSLTAAEPVPAREACS